MPDTFPIARYLTPATPAQDPEGFTMIDYALSGGLPASIVLTSELTLVVGVPSGLANAWREADPLSTVTSSLGQWQPYEPAAGAGVPPDFMTCSPRLILIRSSEIVAAAPAVAGASCFVPAGGEAQFGTLVELYVDAWDIRAGAIVGAGDTVSRIRFGWRAADAASTQFAPPPVSPNIVSALRRRQRAQSQIGSSVKRASAGYATSPSFPLATGVEVQRLLDSREYFIDSGRLTGLPLGWERL